MTDEEIEIKKNVIGDLTIQGKYYVVECQSLGGFSGSPVFFERERITREKVYVSPEIYLGGVMKGHFNDMTSLERGHELNVGLALVTPCYMLNDLLHTETARKERERLEAQS